MTCHFKLITSGGKEQILPSKLALIKTQTADSALLQELLDLYKSEITEIFPVK